MNENEGKNQDEELRSLVVFEIANNVLKSLQEANEDVDDSDLLSDQINRIIFEIRDEFQGVVENLLNLSNNDSSKGVEKGLYNLTMGLPGKLTGMAFELNENPIKQEQLLDIKEMIVKWYGAFCESKHKYRSKYEPEQIFGVVRAFMRFDIGAECFALLEDVLQSYFGKNAKKLFKRKLTFEELIVSAKLIMQTRIRRAEIVLNEAFNLETIHIEGAVDEISGLMNAIDNDISIMYQNNSVDDDYIEDMREEVYLMMRKLIFGICRLETEDDSEAEVVVDEWKKVIEGGKVDPDINMYFVAAKIEQFRSMLNDALHKFENKDSDIHKLDSELIDVKDLLGKLFVAVRSLHDSDGAEVAQAEITRAIFDFTAGAMKIIEQAIIDDNKFVTSLYRKDSNLIYSYNYLSSLLDLLVKNGFEAEEVAFYKAWIHICLGQTAGNMKEFLESEKFIEKAMYQLEDRIKTSSEISQEEFSQMLNLHYFIGLAEIEHINSNLFNGEIVDNETYFYYLNSFNKRISKMQNIERRLSIAENETNVDLSDTLQRLLDKILEKNHNDDVKS
ncbi:hypothetical protein KKD70_00555 [Patescibacteria group bacterium]|nr:hypothetical protein [Patescibacteria group bacterium]